MCGSTVGESVPGMTWSGIEAEVNLVLAPLGRLTTARLAVTLEVDKVFGARRVWLAPTRDRAIFNPRLVCGMRSGGHELDHYLRIREMVLPNLWWKARLVGAWLCAPAFERPAQELVSFLAGSRRVLTELG